MTTPPMDSAADAAPTPLVSPKTARTEWQVLRELTPYLKPFVGRILFALALVVAGKLATHTHPFAMSVRRLDRMIDECQDARMQTVRIF